MQGTYLDTIHPIENARNLKRRPEIGQRLRLSEGDIAQTKLLYKCPSKFSHSLDSLICLRPKTFGRELIEAD